VSLHLDPCNSDTDGDGMQDGWEYRSAIDLNNAGCGVPAYPTPCAPATPYPFKVSYPNPLDGTDAGVDYDGDWITAKNEYTAWYRHPGHDLTTAGMWYSDGLQASQDDASITSCVGMAPYAPLALPAAYTLDTDAPGRPGYGCLSDDERDEDGDGLSNNEELNRGTSAAGFWKTIFPNETNFRVNYAGTNWLDGDTDGDGIVDGLDDQDFDDFLNIEELRRGRQSVDDQSVSTGITTGLWVDAFNPCLPWPDSRTCPRYVPPTGAWTPFESPAIAPRWPLWSGSTPPTHPLMPRPS
jgi:hypothetical protein